MIIAGIVVAVVSGFSPAAILSSASIDSGTSIQTPSPEAISFFNELQSISYDNPVGYQLYTEPTNVAFSILVPQGWTANGQISVPLGTLQAAFTAESPDGTKQIFFQKPRPQSYWTPTPFQPEGSSSHLGAVVYHYYKNTDQYVQDILIPDFRQMSGIDLQVVAKNNLLDGYGYSAGAYILTFPRSGLEDGAMLAFVTTYGVPGPSGDIAIWFATIDAIVTPKSELAAFSEVGINSLMTMTANPQVVGEYIEGAGRSSSVMAENTDAFLNVLRSSPMSSDVIADPSQYILGVEQVMNPSTSEKFTVPIGLRWYDPTTQTFYESNPGDNPSIIELQPVN
jgi:hypothetical protein